MKWWLNGQLVAPESVNCSVQTYSLHYGVSIFEGIRAYEVNGQPNIFRLESHINRFYDSAKMLGFSISAYQPEQIIDACEKTVAHWSESNLYIRPLLYLGNGVMGIRTNELDYNLIIMVWPYSIDRLSDRYQKGISVNISRHKRNRDFALAKVSGNYLASVVAANELAVSGYDEAILLDENGFISEATAQNIFIVKDEKMKTPRLSACLAGITRKSVMDIAEHMNIEVSETDILPVELLTADEAFLTSTASEILPIRSINYSHMASTHYDSVTRRIMRKYHELVLQC